MLTQQEKSTYISSFILFSIGLAGFFFKLFFNIFLARHISSALYGDFSVSLSVFNIISAYMLFGTATSSLRFIPTYLKNQQHDVASKYVTWNLRIVFVTSFIFLILLTLFTIVFLGLHLFHIRDIREYHLVVYFLWIAPIGALSLLLTTYILCDQNILLGTFFGSVGFYFFGFILLVPTIYLFDIQLHSETLWFLVTCIMILVILAQSTILFLSMRSLLTNSVVNFFNRLHSDKDHEKEWWRVSIKLILNQLIFLIVTALDLLLLKIIDHNQSVVGHYAAAITVAGIIWITQQSIFQLVSPKVSSLLEKEGGKKELQALVTQSEIINLALNSVLILVIAYFSTSILTFFGPEYVNAKISLWILLGGTFIATLSTGAPKLLAYSGHESYLLRITGYQIVVIAVVGSVLIYEYSIVGAALAAALTWGVRTVMSIYYVRKVLGIRVAVWV